MENHGYLPLVTAVVEQQLQSSSQRRSERSRESFRNSGEHECEWLSPSDEQWQMLHLSEDAIIVDPSLVGTDSSDDVYDCESARRWSAASTKELPFVSALAEPLLSPAPVSLTTDTEAQAYSRPEFLFLRLEKQTQDQKVGLCFRQGPQGGTIVSRVVPSGLASQGNLKVGDRVMSVNNRSCLAASPSQVVELIGQVENVLDVIVHNPEGCSETVSTCVQVPKNIDRVGVTLKLDRGAVHVSRVHSDSLFCESTLQAGHRVVWVNRQRCENMTLQVAAELLHKYNSGFCTIVSKPDYRNALVLACDSQRTIWGSFALGLGMAVGAASAVRSLT